MNVLHTLRAHRFVVIAFVTGFGLMAYELAAARVLSPGIGSSTYVWTSVIGVIIAALSLGYFVGGRIADRRAQVSDIAWLLLLASISVTGTLILYQDILTSVVEAFADNRIQAVMATLVLFAPASFLLGTISPYLAKLNVQSLESAGRSVASLSTFNSLGGITGTFVTGFILFGYIGSRDTLSLVALLLLAASWTIAPRYRMVQRLFASAFIAALCVIPVAATVDRISIDTPSAHYTVINGRYEDQAIVGLLTGPGGIQSASFANGLPEPVFWYTQEMTRLTVAQEPKRILMLGGGAFTMPQYLAERLPNAIIDVVEIDPELKGISEKYFRYKNPTNVNLYFEDARTFVNRSKQTYDAILVDVYGDTLIPYSLITKEYGRKVAGLLAPNGQVVANVIAGTTGPCREVFSAVNAAYQSSMPHAQFVRQPGASPTRSNNVVVYSKQPVELYGYNVPPAPLAQPFTDNYSPAERLYYNCQRFEQG